MINILEKQLIHYNFRITVIVVEIYIEDDQKNQLKVSGFA